MTQTDFTFLFVFVLLANFLVRIWLSTRQVRHVIAHRAQVPAAFADSISLHAHQRAADYTVAKSRFGMLDIVASTMLLIGLTLLGGLQAIYVYCASALGDYPLLAQLLFVTLIAVISGLFDLPFSWWRRFVLEERFGFNRMSLRLFVSDQVRGALLGAAIGLPLLALVLWLMQRSGDLWWLYVWLVWTVFSLLISILYPTVIAPRFNKFDPLPEGELRGRVEALLQRCGFTAKGLFVMDGSTRSSHGNAYFTGFGKAKQIVFFDTLIERLSADQIEAVLAHELGHFKHKHVLKRLVTMVFTSFAGLALLGWLSLQTWFYQGLGMTPGAIGFEAPALILFLLVSPVFTFVLRPLTSFFSRRDEFEADLFASKETKATDLVDALLKLYKDNASTLTPDPLHSAFYDSHPSASERIGRLLSQTAN